MIEENHFIQELKEFKEQGICEMETSKRKNHVKNLNDS